MICFYLTSKSCCSWPQEFRSRPSKWHWMLQFYIVRQRCLLDMPYHKYHLLLISGLPSPVRFWLKFIVKELRGGLSFTAEAWQQGEAVIEPSQSRPGGRKKKTKFQKHNGQNQSSAHLSGLRDERHFGLEGEEGCYRETTYLPHLIGSVMKKYSWFLTACWWHRVTWRGVFRILNEWGQYERMQAYCTNSFSLSINRNSLVLLFFG